MSVRGAFADQARSCAALGSPLTAQIVGILGQALKRDQGAVARRVLEWPGDASSRGDSVPLRMAGALHALVLTGQAPELARAYTAGSVDADLILTTIAVHENAVMRWLDSPPQTNEVGRAAPLIVAARFLAGLHPMPLELRELGASAGLNLNFHRYHLAPDRGAAPDPGIFEQGETVLRPVWSGALPDGEISVVSARGVDLRPIHPVGDAGRLLAYCWSDQTERMARLQAALAIAAQHPPVVDEGDAADWLQDQLARPAPGRLRMVFHTVAWQYFPPAVQASCEASFQQAGAAASPAAPLAHFSMEADGGRGAALHLRLWDGRLREWALGRADFHGRWVEWDPAPL